MRLKPAIADITAHLHHSKFPNEQAISQGIVLRVPIDDIVARGYNLDVKSPHGADEAHRDPAELLAEYQQAQAAVAEVRDKLRKELESALL
jgi:type I restriction-modification system DNA methylase subunit